MSGHKVMAKNCEQVGKFENFDFFGHNFMANDRIVVFFSFNDSYRCGESNGIWISWIQSDLRKLWGQLSANVATQHDISNIFYYF